MPRTCTICSHSERDAVERALIAGEPYRHIAERFGTSTTALQRHRADHLPQAMVKAQEAKEVASADDLLSEVRALRSKAYSILMAAEKTGDYRTALMGIREARGCLELLAKLLGELDDRPQVNLLMAPEWGMVRAALFAALAPYPDARVAVADRLLLIGGGHAG